MALLKKILFIVNPISGGVDKSEMTAMVKAVCKKKEIELVTLKTTGKNDVEKIKAVLVDKKLDRVIVAGGDGTIKTVAAALKGTDIPLAILPLGSANGMVANLNFPITQEEQLELAFTGTFQTIDLLKLNGELCLHIADMGINAELVKNYEEGTLRGKLGYALKTIPTLWNSTYPFTFEITANGVTKDREGVLLAFANARSYGTGATINPEGKLDDGKMEIIVFKSLDIIEIFRTLGDTYDFDTEVVEILSTDKAVVKCKSPVPFQIDGEYIGETTEVTASIFKEKLILVVPESFSL